MSLISNPKVSQGGPYKNHKLEAMCAVPIVIVCMKVDEPGVAKGGETKDLSCWSRDFGKGMSAENFHFQSPAVH